MFDDLNVGLLKDVKAGNLPLKNPGLDAITGAKSKFDSLTSKIPADAPEELKEKLTDLAPRLNSVSEHLEGRQADMLSSLDMARNANKLKEKIGGVPTCESFDQILGMINGAGAALINAISGLFDDILALFDLDLDGFSLSLAINVNLDSIFNFLSEIDLKIKIELDFLDDIASFLDAFSITALLDELMNDACAGQFISQLI